MVTIIKAKEEIDSRIKDLESELIFLNSIINNSENQLKRLVAEKKILTITKQINLLLKKM